MLLLLLLRLLRVVVVDRGRLLNLPRAEHLRREEKRWTDEVVGGEGETKLT